MLQVPGGKGLTSKQPQILLFVGSAEISTCNNDVPEADLEVQASVLTSKGCAHVFLHERR